MMSTRTYLALLVVRLYLALQPSYIHPDENFQGPEVVAGMSPLPLLHLPYPKCSPSCLDSGELPSSIYRALRPLDQTRTD